jgi:Domain of unknown function (DUF5753)/Helix-turn-helix domain
VAARANGSGVSLRSRWLGEQMRRLRQERGLTLWRAASVAGVDYTVVKDHENGIHVFHHRQVARLLDLYSTYDRREHDRLLQLARDVGQSRTRDSDSDMSAPDPALLDRQWLEGQSSRIRCHSTILLPGLLQIPAYAAAVDHRGHELVGDTSVVDTLSGGLHVVVEEQVLRRLVGDADVQRQQLRHLAEVIRAPNIHVQIHIPPARTGRRDSMGGAFAVFDLPNPYPATVAVSEGAAGLTVHEGRPARRYAAAFDHLVTTALDHTASAELITSLAGQTA